MSATSTAKGRRLEGQKRPHGASAEPAVQAPWWRRNVLPLSLASGLLLWAALPPLGWSPLAWVAPLGWLLLIRMDQLPGRRPYWCLWAAATAYWLATLQGVRHPHWVLYFGWAALSMYLAVYPLLFVGLSRVAVHRLRIPLAVAAPVVWVAMELARGHVFTGFSMALLGHAVISWTPLIQIADLAGAYLVSALVMLAAAAVAGLIPLPSAEEPSAEKASAGKVPASPSALFRWAPLAAAVLAVAAAWAYGSARLRNEQPEANVTVALLQGGRDVFYEYDPQRNQEMFAAYRRHTLRACQKHPDIRLVVWPESSLAANRPEVILEGPVTAPPEEEMTDAEFAERVEYSIQMHRAELQALAGSVNRGREAVSMIVGGEAIHASGSETTRYNSATLLDPSGEVVARYYKMHPVPFGEFIPLGSVFPVLYDITPMPEGLSAGREPLAMQVGQLRLSPSICFESTVPHLIRRQVAQLRRAGEMPDVLVNITNDGWFHGSSILDLQSRCAAFRAVENGRPMLVSANGGITSWFDRHGRQQAALPRRQEDYLIARVGPGRGVTVYQRIGDWPAGLCLLAAAVFAVAGMAVARRRS